MFLRIVKWDADFFMWEIVAKNNVIVAESYTLFPSERAARKSANNLRNRDFYVQSGDMISFHPTRIFRKKLGYRP